MSTSMQPTVGLVYPLAHEEASALLAARATVLRAAEPTAFAIAELVRQVDGIIVRGPARLTAEHLAGAPRLRVIAVTGSGTNHVDVAAATAHGIPVINGVGVAPHSVAEYAIGALVACQRDLLGFHRQLTAGTLVWSERATRYERPGLHGSTVGLVGYGHIARLTARMAVAAFDAQVLAYDPYVDAIGDAGVTRVDDLHELLDRSFSVSVHVPLTEATRGLLGRDELRRIGPQGCLVNTSRGGVVDESALLEVLRAGELGAACTDVFEHEPPRETDLAAYRATPNLIVTPHIAGITSAARSALEQAAVSEVLRALAGHEPRRVVNPEVFEGAAGDLDPSPAAAEAQSGR